MKRNQITKFIALIILVASLILLYQKTSFSSEEITVNQRYSAKYVRVVDGDTAIFNVNNEDCRVRFIGIDTPESVKPNTSVEKYGKEASNFTKEALENAEDIILETDSEAKLYDKHERLLAYVFIDDELLQAKLLENGLAKVKYIYGDYKYLDELYTAQDIAKTNKLNLWAN